MLFLREGGRVFAIKNFFSPPTPPGNLPSFSFVPLEGVDSLY